MRIAINGMGRIGRLLFRRLSQEQGMEVVAINDVMNRENLLYLLKHDSIYGTSDITVNAEIFKEAEPLKLPWKSLEADVVLECTGRFTTYESAAQHLKAGAQKVLLSTTGSDDIPLLIWGYNQHALKKEVAILSPGGCMTNCCVHVLYLLNSIGIESAAINVVHSYTSRQELVDAPHKDFRRGRAAAESIIPVPVDLYHSLERLLPSLKNKISTMTTRVPVANGAFADFSVVLKKKVSVEEVNAIFKKAAGADYNGILEYTEEPIVSLDVKTDPHSAIIAGDLTTIVGKQLKLYAFFDNEYGYTSRIIDWLRYWKKNV